MADVCLCALLDAHFEVDGVAYDVYLNRVEVVEQVTVVPVVVTHGVVVLREAFLHLLLVVDVAFLHAQGLVEVVAGDDGIAYPRDVAQVVLLAFVDFDEDIDVFLVDSPYGVFEDGSVAIAQLIVFLDEGLLGLVVAFGGVLLGFEHVAELAGLVDFSEGTFLEHVTLDFLVGELFVTFEDNLANLHLRLLVDSDVEDDLVLAGDVVALNDFDDGIVIAFLVEVFLGQDLGTVNHVGRNLCTTHNAQFGVHVLALGFFQTKIVDGTDARTCSQMDTEIDLIAHKGVGGDGNLREESVLPVSPDGLGNLCAWHVDGLSYGES